MIEIEEWRPVRGFEDVYHVSNLGRVKRVRQGKGARAGKILRMQPDKFRRLFVDLRDNTRRCNRTVHSLVANAFLGPRPDGLEVNHKDGNPSNCRLSNLEYVMHVANISHSVANGLNCRGSRQGHAKLDELQVQEIRRMLAAGHRQLMIAEQFGVSPGCITDINRGVCWRHVA